MLRGCGAESIVPLSLCGSVTNLGLENVAMELGSPAIVLPDSGLGKAANAVVATGFSYASPACISAHRVLAHDRVYADLLDSHSPRV